MRKIIFLFIVFFTLFFNFDSSYSSCNPTEAQLSDPNFKVWTALNDCLSDSTLVWGDAEIWGWFDETIQNWTKNISLFLWIFAVLGIVYGSFMLTTSAWEDEKINKAKDTIKWSIIGFIWLITASFLINLLVKVIYSIKFN